MNFISQFSTLFGFSSPLSPEDAYTGNISQVPVDCRELLLITGDMLDYTDIPQFTDVVVKTEGDYSLRIRREQNYLHLQLLEISTNISAILWWTSSSNRHWWICVGIDTTNNDLWLVAVSDSNSAWTHAQISSGSSAAADMVKRFFGYTTPKSGGGAGSGYIGNSLLSNKKMVGYNVPTSSAESTKTESVEDASESPVSGKPKIGNGYAKIRFLRPLEEKSIVAEMLASNQLKVNGNGEAPTITSGSFGTYDSATDSYYFANNCRMDWKNWSALGVDLDKISRLTKIEFEWEGQIRNTSYGHAFDEQMQTYFNTNLLFINGIADGYDDASADDQRFARIKNSGSDQWQTTEEVPFNNSSYQNAFHKVKWVWEIENSVAKKITIYLDNVVFCTHTDIDYEFEITALGNQFLRCDVIDHTNVKSVKVAFYYMG